MTSGLSRSQSLQEAVPATRHLVETRCQEPDRHLMATIKLDPTKHTGAPSEFQCENTKREPCILRNQQSWRGSKGICGDKQNLTRTVQTLWAPLNRERNTNTVEKISMAACLFLHVMFCLDCLKLPVNYLILQA